MTFYKVLVKRTVNTVIGEFSEYKSPFMWEDAPLGKLLSEKEQDVFRWQLIQSRMCHELHKGGFHLFKNKDDADEWSYQKLNNEFCPFHGLVVVKAIVPKGTKYVEGKFGPYEAVAVKNVKYEEI